jgi:hypothetical protein
MEMHLWNTGVVRLPLLGSPPRADDSYQHDDDDDDVVFTIKPGDLLLR